MNQWTYIRKSFVNFLLVLLVTSYTEMFKVFEKWYKIVSSTFETKHNSIQFC